MTRFLVAAVLVLLLTPAVPAVPGQETVDVRVAVYFSVIEDYADEVVQALDCSWESNGVTYRLAPVVIDRGDVMRGGEHALTPENFDVLAIPGSGRPYLDALHPVWRNRVREFVAGGGGYLGICGGANLASMGFQEPLGPNSVLERGVLGLANVYVNDQQHEEWQYLWKANWEQGMPPVEIYIAPADNPIFAGCYDEKRGVRYGGGPGMYPAHDQDPLLGPVVPLAVYAQEPMQVAPLHFWRWRQGEWEIWANVTTDIRGQWAAVATTYGRGRVVLFGPHPEKPTWFGGRVEEFPVRPRLGPFTWFIYNWTGGRLSAPDYNWWMLQRAAAWLAGAPLPPDTEAPARATAPSTGGLLLRGRLLMPLLRADSVPLSAFS